MIKKAVCLILLLISTKKIIKINNTFLKGTDIEGNAFTKIFC